MNGPFKKSRVRIVSLSCIILVSEMDTKGFSNDLILNFITRDPKYAVPSFPINVKSTSTPEEFDQIIKSLIAKDNANINLENIEFEFLINGKILRNEIKDFIQKENINPEVNIEVEYFAKFPPAPHKSLSHDDWVSSVDTIDDWIISGCYDYAAHIWNAKTGECKLTILGHLSPIKAVKWIRNNKINENIHSFVTCSHDETAMLWNWDYELNKIEHVYTFKGHCRSVDCVDSLYDLIVTGSYDCHLKIWSIVEDENVTSKSKLQSPILTLAGHKEAITGCVWLENEKLSTVATVSLDNMLKIWDIEVGELKQKFSSNKSLLGVSYNPEKKLFITASCDKFVRLWDLKDNQQMIKSTFSSHDGWISSVCWSKKNSNLFVSGSYDNSLKQWDIRSPSVPLYDLLGHTDKIMSVNWSNERFIVSGGADSQIKIFSV